MPRTLTAPYKSTPTFLFNITDADSSGVDFDGMSAMMCLQFVCKGAEDTVTDFRYVLPVTDIADLWPSVPAENFWMDNSYSRVYSGKSSFAITIPLWRYTVPTGYILSAINYQVFIYSNNIVNRTVTTIDEDGNDVITPGKVLHHNIMIDDGTIELTESFFPLMYAAEMSQDVPELYACLTPAEIALIGTLDTSAWENDGETELGSAAGMSKEIISAMFKLIPKYNLDDPPTTSDELSRISLDRAHTIIAADIHLASKYAPSKFKPSVS